MRRKLLYVMLGVYAALLCTPANAAQVTVTWTNPTEYEPACTTDATTKVTTCTNAPLKDLVSVRVEWGTCDASGIAFGTKQGAVSVPTTVPGAKVSTKITPTGIAKLCVRAFAINSKGVVSSQSLAAVKDLLPSLGKPVTLGKPVILNFTSDDKEF